MGYETQGGMPTPSLIYKELSETLVRAQELSALMAHFYNTEEHFTDTAQAKRWIMVSELFKQVKHKIMMMEIGRAQ